MLSTHLLRHTQLDQHAEGCGLAAMATRSVRKPAVLGEDSAEDLAAKVRLADEAIARARAEQQAASDRLAREVRPCHL